MITPIGPEDAQIGAPPKLVWSQRRMVLVLNKAFFPKMQYHGLRGRMRATAELGMTNNKSTGRMEWYAEVALDTDTLLLFRVRGSGGTPEEAAEDAFAEVDARAAVLAVELRGA